MKKLKKGLIIAAIVLVALVGLFLVYVSDFYPAQQEAQDCLVQAEETEDYILFSPEEPKAGLIFYPGGKVEEEAYAPLMAELAEKGILGVLIRMPHRLAFLDPDAAEGIPEQFPEIRDWYIGGHSLGGAIAAAYAGKNMEQFRGLVLLASYSTADLSASGMKVLSIFGSEDGVLTRSRYEELKSMLPKGFTELVIRGGCHAWFGDYGSQEGDGTPTISPEEQLKQTVNAILKMIAQ